MESNTNPQNIIDQIVDHQKSGYSSGIVSICSSHPDVLKAAIQYKQKKGTHLLIESTSNQVNQFGGYTGLRPEEFSQYVRGLAEENGLTPDRLTLGGDHLGPLVWQNEHAEQAMMKAKTLVEEYVRAGFRKIHLDCSMPLGAERELPLELIAQRTSFLAKAAEAAADDPSKLRYIVGSEVPTAGGIMDEKERLTVTSPKAAFETIEAIRNAFEIEGLKEAWGRVRGLVVQPGVEFGDSLVHVYAREKTRKLTEMITSEPSLIFEAHSTDYQRPAALKALVEDHFGILKVGPWLTYALREGLIALAKIETFIQPENNSRLVEILDKTMLAYPSHWENYYHGNLIEKRISRLFSYSDRIRYYWHRPEVERAVKNLFVNLSNSNIPLTLISQYLPAQYQKIRDGLISSDPKSLVMDKIWEVLEQL